MASEIIEAGDPAVLREANAIHRALLGCDAPVDLRHQYASALQMAGLGHRAGIDVGRLIDRDADLEAIEIALRRDDPRNPLTQRFHVVCYLAEVRPENYSRFVNERRRCIAGSLTLAGHLFRSAYKYVKGRCLLRSHDIG
jgi:hypothetical protein